MGERSQLVGSGQGFERLALPDGLIVGDQIEHLRRQHEEAAIDHAAVSLRLLFEGRHAVVGMDVQRTETAGRIHGCQGCLTPVGSMETDQFTHVHVANAVTVGEAEILVGRQVVRQALEPATGHRAFSGINERDAPGLCKALVNLHLVLLHVEGDIRHVQKVVGEILFYNITFVAATDDEIIDAVRGIYF